MDTNRRNKIFVTYILFVFLLITACAKNLNADNDENNPKIYLNGREYYRSRVNTPNPIAEAIILAKLQIAFTREQEAKTLWEKYSKNTFDNKTPFTAGNKVLEKLSDYVGAQSGDYDYYCLEIFMQEGGDGIRKNLKTFLLNKSRKVIQPVLGMILRDKSIDPGLYRDIILDYANNDESENIRNAAAQIIGKMKTDDFLKLKNLRYIKLGNIIDKMNEAYNAHNVDALCALMDGETGFSIWLIDGENDKTYMRKTISIKDARDFFLGKYELRASRLVSIKNIRKIQPEEQMFDSYNYKRDGSGNLYIRSGENDTGQFFPLFGVDWIGKESFPDAKTKTHEHINLKLAYKAGKWYFCGIEGYVDDKPKCCFPVDAVEGED